MIKNKLTIKMVQAALKKNLDFVDHCTKCKQKENPQVVRMSIQAAARVDALQAVLDAMRGDASGMTYI